MVKVLLDMKKKQGISLVNIDLNKVKEIRKFYHYLKTEELMFILL
jgi:hypothetical protein